MAARRARLAEHRAHAALIRAGFADQAIAAQVLRQVQVLTRTRDLARLDYTTAERCPGSHRLPDHLRRARHAARPAGHARRISHARRPPGRHIPEPG